jgi:Transposase zinc-binding domain
MPEVAAGLRRDGREDRARLGQDRLPSHRRARDALMHCRTEALGGQLWPWDHGGQAHEAYHACRHRRCPPCHPQDPEAWLAARWQARLPLPSCPGVLTLPSEWRARVRRHQNDLYDLLLRAAAQALIQLARDPHEVGGVSAVLWVLPPWTRPLADQPHGHGRVPAGGAPPPGPRGGQPARPPSCPSLPSRSSCAASV